MDRLRELARIRETSIAALLRSAVDQLLAQDDMIEIRKRARRAAASAHYRSGLTDLSVNHDKYLAEDFLR